MTDDYEYTTTELETKLRDILTTLFTEEVNDRRIREICEDAIRQQKNDIDKIWRDTINDLREAGYPEWRIEETAERRVEDKEYYSDAIESFRSSFRRAMEALESGEIQFTEYDGNEQFDGEIELGEEIHGNVEYHALSYDISDSGEETLNKRYPMVRHGHVVCTGPAKKFQPSPLCKHEIAFLKQYAETELGRLGGGRSYDLGDGRTLIIR